MHRPRPSRAIALASAAAIIGALLASSSTAACSGALVTFGQINAEATRIVVGRVRAIRGDPGAPDGLAISVEGVVRGSAEPEIFLLPPTFAGCDSRISEPIGTRLLIATGPQYFDANAPEDLHPYWLLGPGDVAQPTGVEDPDARHRTLGDLVAALGGELVLIPTADPVTAADQPIANDDAGPRIAALGFLLVVAAGMVVGLGYFVTRRSKQPGS